MPLLAFSSDFIFFEGSSLERFILKAEEAKVIYLGETHDREDIHQLQLRILKELDKKGYEIVLLMEAFQQPFQEALDEYVEGYIDEEEMLKRTEYKRRWGFDKELYAPLWRFARERGIKLIALNVPSELVRDVKRRGLGKVRSGYLPEKVMPLRKEHREFILKAMKEHKSSVEKSFLDVQLAWDTGMAYKIAKTALAYPRAKLVVIVGSGHVWRGYGIPERVNFLLGDIPQLVSYVQEDTFYFLFSKDFSRDNSSTNSSKEPN